MPTIKTTLVRTFAAFCALTGATAAVNAEDGTVIGIYRDFGLIVRIPTDGDQSFPCHTHIVVEEKFALPFNENSCEPTAPVSAERKKALEDMFGQKQEGQARKILVEVPQVINIDDMQHRNCGMLTGKIRIANSSVTLADYMTKFGYKKTN